MNRYAVLYLVTLFVLVPLDFLFLGIVAKDFFTSQVGNMLGEIKLAPAILFYLLYVVGIVIFVNGAANANWQSTLLYGALFGLFCYATFDLTVAVAAAALELAGRNRRHLLGRDRDGGLIDRRACLWPIGWCREFNYPSLRSEAKQSISPSKERMDCFVARAPRNDGEAHFGCGTIRMYGFGDFQPCG